MINNNSRIIFLIFCFKMLYDKNKNYVDYSKQLLSDVKLIKQHTIYDTPKMKQKLKSQLLSILKQSFGKALLKKQTEINWKEAEQEKQPDETQNCLSKVKRKLCFENNRVDFL